MKKHISTSVRPGFAPLLVIGLVTIVVFIAAVTFGPWKLDRLGSLTNRQQQQESQAATALWPPAGDTDQDGFTDTQEKYMKTDSADNCADDANDAAWPPDVNNDKQVNQADVDAFKPFYNSSIGSKNYNRRFDINNDKKVNLADVVLIGPYLNTSCPFYFLKVTPSYEKVIFEWTPGINDGSISFYMQDRFVAEQCGNGTPVDRSSPLSIGQTSFNWYDANIKFRYCAWLHTSSQRVSPYVEFQVPFQPPTLPIGMLDGPTGNVICDKEKIRGWAYDPDDYGYSVIVNIFFDRYAGEDGNNTPDAVLTANTYRLDLNTAYPNHGFEMAIPESLQNSASHTIHAYPIDNANAFAPVELGDSPKSFTCGIGG